ncbi:hypothetical protein CDAR_273701 [Caerostris darwini]|uniref:Uncharacterized protein n=1 Tax=Caerostris darwini TaxID=1538125 RepID=A0AAV4W719_9ARAC|nr:hypothetical protein CDAR_273701 [Caerostris darwini]
MLSELCSIAKQRHKKGNNNNKKSSGSETSKSCHIQEVIEENELDDNPINALEEDLSELINMCKTAHESAKSEGEDNPAVVDDSEESDEKEVEHNSCANKKETCSSNGCCKNVSCMNCLDTVMPS